MDPQCRFTNEYQALRYVREHADELAAAYGKAEEPRIKLTETLNTALRNGLMSLRAYMKRARGQSSATPNEQPTEPSIDAQPFVH